jgi:hypothetical protein
VSKFIASDEIFFALRRAGAFTDDPNDVRRVIIDLERDSPARVYIERFLDDSIIDVFLVGGIQIITHEGAT